MKYIRHSLFYIIGSLFILSSCDVTKKDELPQGVEDDIELSLNFSPFDTIRGHFFGQDVGFAGHTDSNSLFFVYRQRNEEGELEQILYRYNVEDKTSQVNHSTAVGGATRFIHILNSEVKVLSNTGTGTYPLDISEEPTWVPHIPGVPTSFTRFGSVLYKDDIYVIGGDLNTNDPDGILSNKIRKWNTSSLRFEVVATMPGSKTWASAEVVNDKLYIFGGQAQWLNTADQSSVFIYDFSTGEFETIEMDEPVSWTYTSVYNGKILVSGQLKRGVTDPDEFEDRDIFFQVFNPVNNQFHEVDINLTDEEYHMIHDMTIVDNEVFVIYGDPTSREPSDDPAILGRNIWTIQRAIVNL